MTNKSLIRSNMGELVDFDALANKAAKMNAGKAQPRKRDVLEPKPAKKAAQPRLRGFVPPLAEPVQEAPALFEQEKPKAEAKKKLSPGVTVGEASVDVKS